MLHFPRHLRKCNTYRDQLVVPSILRTLVLNTCHDSPASGGHLAFKATFDEIREDGGGLDTAVSVLRASIVKFRTAL